MATDDIIKRTADVLVLALRGHHRLPHDLHQLAEDNELGLLILQNPTHGSLSRRTQSLLCSHIHVLVFRIASPSAQSCEM